MFIFTTPGVSVHMCIITWRLRPLCLLRLCHNDTWNHLTPKSFSALHAVELWVPPSFRAFCLQKGKLKLLGQTLYLKWNLTWIISLPSINHFHIWSVDREESIVYVYILQGFKYQPSWYWHELFLQARNQTFVSIQFISDLWFAVLVCMILCLHKNTLNKTVNTCWQMKRKDM